MHRVKCDQCDWSAAKETRGKAILSLNMHKGRAHGKMKPKPGPRTPKPKEKPQEPQVKIHYCPQCGFNLQILARAVLLLSRVIKR